MKRELLKNRCQTWEHEGKVIILSTRYRRACGIRMNTQKQTCKLHLYLLMMWTCGHVHSHTGLQVMQCTRHTNINVQHFFFFFFCSHSSVAIVINTWESCKQAGWVTPGVRVCVCWRESCKWECAECRGTKKLPQHFLEWQKNYKYKIQNRLMNTHNAGSLFSHNSVGSFSRVMHSCLLCFSSFLWLQDLL